MTTYLKLACLSHALMATCAGVYTHVHTHHIHMHALTCALAHIQNLEGAGDVIQVIDCCLADSVSVPAM